MTKGTDNPTTDTIFDEFSPKKIILQVRAAGIYLLCKWKLIVITALICGLAGAVYSYFKKPDYVAELTFALDEGIVQHAKSSFPDLSEELGLGPAFDAGGVFSSMTNIVELMQSRLLVEKTLRNSVTIAGKSLTLADFFLDSLDYREKWMKGSPFLRMSILSQKNNGADSLFENNILRTIYETIIAKNIKIDKKGKETTIIAVTCTSHNELFSKYFLETLINEVGKYYVDTKTQRARINLAFIQKRTDSVRGAYNTALYGRATYEDEHMNPVLQIASVSKDKQQTDIQILRTSYIELTKSLEAAKTALIRDTPLIQYVDIPLLPLKVLKSNMLKFFLIFFFLGGFLLSGGLLVRKLWMHILAA